MDDITQRVCRLYAAIDETVEKDVSRLRAYVLRGPHAVELVQDFSGGDTSAQMENAMQQLIALIGGLEYHLRRWASHNGRQPEEVASTFHNSRSLRLIHDLWNNDKHGYPPRRSRSGDSPQIRNIRRVMRLTTGSQEGSVVGMRLGLNGQPLPFGDGTVAGVLTGEIFDGNGNFIEDADGTLERGVSECEDLLMQLGLFDKARE